MGNLIDHPLRQRYVIDFPKANKATHFCPTYFLLQMGRTRWEADGEERPSAMGVPSPNALFG
jgi:hypothetical protein